MTKQELANYIISKFSGSITPMKLQKLLYYCYAWQLVIGKKFFSASFEAWPHGPVDKDIYHTYKQFKKDPIPANGEVNVTGVPEELDFILDSYGVFSAIELSKTTHAEAPWKKFKDTENVIPDNVLIDFYTAQPFKKNFPLNEANGYYPPKTSSHYSFTFDMNKGYVPVFESLQDFKNSFNAHRTLAFDMLGHVGKN